MKNGDLNIVTITGVAPNGAGTVLIEDRTLHVAGGAPGDVLNVRIDAVSKQRPMAFGHIFEVLSRGDSFVEPPCHHAAPLRGSCGGCAVMHLTADAQRAAKLAVAQDALTDLGVTVEMMAPEGEVYYRNRSNFSVWKTEEGRVHFGSRTPRTGDFARMDGCRVLALPLADVASAVVAQAEKAGIPIAPAPHGLRHFSVRNDGQRNVIVELITNGAAKEWIGPFCANVLRIQHVCGVAHSQNGESTNALRVSPAVHMAGLLPLEVTHGGVKFGLSTDSFFQLNYPIAERMVQDAITELKSTIGDREGAIWDLYAGVGALGVPLALATGRSLFAAESVPAAVKAMTAAADGAGVTATIASVDLQKGFPRGWDKAAAVVVDPPRKGLSAKVLERIANMDCAILYMSCNAETFARDAKALVAAGRTLRSVRAYDMLPQTAHVELLSLFDAPRKEA